MDTLSKSIKKRKRNQKYITSLCNDEDVYLIDKKKKNNINIKNDEKNSLKEKKMYTVNKVYYTRNRCTSLKNKNVDNEKNKLINSFKKINYDLEKGNIKIDEILNEEKGRTIYNEVSNNSKSDLFLISNKNDYSNSEAKIKIKKSEKNTEINSEIKNQIKSERNHEINLEIEDQIKLKNNNGIDLEYNKYKNMEEIPVINATMEELSNPILFFEKYNSIGLKYGAMKVKPPKFFKPQFNSYYLNMKFNIRRQKINELKRGREFDHPEEYWSLYEVYKYNEILENLYFPNEKKSIENIEKKYWQIINNEKEQVVSIYGADLPVSKNHPTCIFQNNLKQNFCNDKPIENNTNTKIPNNEYKEEINNDIKYNTSYNKCDINNKSSLSFYNIINNKLSNREQNKIVEVINLSDDDNTIKIENKVDKNENIKNVKNTLRNKKDLENSINKKENSLLKQREKYFTEINKIIKGINENLNIKSLPFIKGSMLRNIDILIEGVNIPWLYIGTLFSSFCWHTEDNYFASINYQHWGKPKIWYVIPPLYSDKVEDIIYEYLKKNSRRKKKGKNRNKENNKYYLHSDNENINEEKKKLNENNFKNYKNGITNINVHESYENNAMLQNDYNFLDVDLNDVELLYRKSYLNYKMVDKKKINFKKENSKHKIYKLTIQVPIDIFLKNNIPVYKNIQRKNEFIFLWPKTFHGGFNSGYNCNEACNIAPTFWLFYGLQSYYNYKYFRNTCISIHFILFSNLLHYHEYTFSQLKHIIYSLRYILTDEYKFFNENKSLFIDFTLNRDALLNTKIMNYSNHLSLDLKKMYTHFECHKNKHFFFQNLKSKLEFFYKDCDACNSPTFNSAIICPHSNDILCIHCSDEHSCNCKFRVTLKRYTLLEMMKILTFLIHYANKIKASNEKEIQFNDIPDYNSLKIFEDKNSIKLYSLIRETKNADIEKRTKSTYYIDLENYCLEKIKNIEEKNKKKKYENDNFIIEDYYTSSNHFKTKLTLKYFFLTYEEEMEDNPIKILPKIIA
ncbi:JmjC domain containing protein, putative [Plasmodium gallinaceum]|uniref:JmjC domain containing protein, putative n=1 Tax=Plasmodium gallinaceum TaxID=5849 RepID=A0A1J1H2W7_PLAGA|nr:JmjC domain containing protein, putative [Plasmodium gallinaceum]CRG97686.1 JmjC domain containing protein, putative [Plasmodium gallinaceum]